MRIRLVDVAAGLVATAAVAFLALTSPVASVDGVSDAPAATAQVAAP